MSVLPHTCNCPYCPGNILRDAKRKVLARDLTIDVQKLVEELKRDEEQQDDLSSRTE